MKLVNINTDQYQFDKLSDGIQKFFKTSQEEPNLELGFIYLSNMSIASRQYLRKEINRPIQRSLVLLSEDDRVASLAWRINALFFIKLPVDITQIGNLCSRVFNFSESDFHPVNRLSINFKGGAKIISINDIVMIEGKGNYCKFSYVDGTADLFTIRIKAVMDRLSYSIDFISLNKSLIINMKNLFKIDHNIAYLRGDPVIKAKLSRLTLKRLKENILWVDANSFSHE